MSVRTGIARLAVLAAVATVGLTVVSVPVEAGPPRPPGAAQSRVFEFTGRPQRWVVPNGVTEAVFRVVGARGGGSIAWPSIGAPGARATATLPLTPGETVHIYVGGAGASPDQRWSCSTPAGGYNGGGAGGRAAGFSGGGGGGGSDVRIGGSTLADRVLVAGGGGGAGSGNGGFGSGGYGGAPTATDGNWGTHPTVPVEGGAGASTVAWGGGGWGIPSPSADGSTGYFGRGGKGGGDLADCPHDGLFFAGGGGGGGYWGGGGGGGYADPSQFSGHFAAGGGGGSSYGPPGTDFESGVGWGDGQVIIEYVL